MIKLFPIFDDRLKQLKHNTLTSYALSQLVLFLLVLILTFKGFLDIKIFFSTFLTLFIFPVLLIILARRNYYIVASLYLGIMYILTVSYLFVVKSLGNGYYGIFIVILFVSAMLFVLTVNVKVGILLVPVSVFVLYLDRYFESEGLINFIEGQPIPTGYYIIFLIVYLGSFLIITVSYSITTIQIFKNYKKELENSQKIRNELKDKNSSLNELNAELEENLSTLEESNFKLDMAFKKVEESDKLKTAFLQNISHEVRTPLNAIVGFLNILKDRNIKNECNFNELIDPTINASYQLLNVIGDIIELSHLDAGTAVFEKHEFNISNVLNEISVKAKDQCVAKNLKFKLINNIQESNDRIISDQWRIAQIINNLLSNAIKFSFKGEVILTTDIKDGKLIIIVKDSGIGIEKDELNEIFKRFRQVETSTSQLFGGLGIGLTIAKELTQRLDGIIRVQSEFGLGSEFSVEIPNISPDSKIVKQKTMNDDLNLNVQKLLIAEDDVSNFKYLEMLLGNYEDIAIFHAWNGQEAVDIFKREKNIDAVLMDIKMPVMDGIEAFDGIKGLNPKVPIFAVTAYAFDHEREKLLTYGFDGYLTKPVKKGEILGLLQLTSDNT